MSSSISITTRLRSDGSRNAGEYMFDMTLWHNWSSNISNFICQKSNSEACRHHNPCRSPRDPFRQSHVWLSARRPVPAEKIGVKSASKISRWKSWMVDRPDNPNFLKGTVSGLHSWQTNCRAGKGSISISIFRCSYGQATQNNLSRCLLPHHLQGQSKKIDL